MRRRGFLLSTASAAALAACAPTSGVSVTPGSSQTLLRGSGAPLVRLELTEFSANPRLVAAFRRGVKTMKAIAGARNVAGWNYWHYSHWMPGSNPPADMAGVWDQCKHGASYFLAWHRGFLAFFEHQLRLASGDPQFALPYWDYYRNPRLPKIFVRQTLNDGSPNPLYWPKRAGTVVAGLKYDAFADGVTTFPWGPGATFEDFLEKNPHNRVHNQVGGSMGEVETAPADPIFWVHHCNIDRYWSAWLAAGKGRHMPPKGDLYWKQRFYYDLSRTWSASISEMVSTRDLGYRYLDLSLPIPPPTLRLPARPPVVAHAPRAISRLQIGLEPISVAIDSQGIRSQSVVLEGVRLTPTGAKGGYSFSLYANLPLGATHGGFHDAFEIGEFGPFEITMPKMTAMSDGAATLHFDLAAALAKQNRAGAHTEGPVVLSFVAFGTPDGVAPRVPVIEIDNVLLA